MFHQKERLEQWNKHVFPNSSPNFVRIGNWDILKLECCSGTARPVSSSKQGRKSSKVTILCLRRWSWTAATKPSSLRIHLRQTVTNISIIHWSQQSTQLRVSFRAVRFVDNRTDSEIEWNLLPGKTVWKDGIFSPSQRTPHGINWTFKLGTCEASILIRKRIER